MSGNNVGQALVDSGHKVTYFDPASGIGRLAESLKYIDVVFPILHGTGGEDGLIQKALEREGVKFVGSNSDVSRNCFDKWLTIQKASTVQFPKSELVNKKSVFESELIHKPYVIKPRAEGSSVDIFIVREPLRFNLEELTDIFTKYNNELLLEEYIEGQEITVGVLGTTALPVVEIIPPNGQEFDFLNKYNGATIENCPPKFVDDALQLEAQTIALRLHKAMKCRIFSRTDMMIDKKGSIYTLEINTLPGMTKESLFPRAAKAAGLSMPELADELINLAIKSS